VPSWTRYAPSVSAYLTLQRVAQASPVAIALLVLANTVPLAGVLVLGWELPSLLVLYWLENGVLGAIAIAKAMTAAADGPVEKPPMAMWFVPPGARRQIGTIGGGPSGPVPVRWVREVVPFTASSGAFWLVHGIVVVFVVLPILYWAAGTPGGQVDALGAMVGGICLLISHGASFRLNWLGRGEYLTADPAAPLNAAYVRTVILHVTIIVSGFIVVVLGSPAWVVALMVLMKTTVDLAAHLGERRQAAARAAVAGASGTGGGSPA
jgi:hypothetical protein